MQEENSLKKMFNMQKDLQKKLLNVELPEHRKDLVSYFALGLFGEIGEVLQADKSWKPWNPNGARDIKNTKEEIADCWLFLINLTLAEGIDAEELFKIFKEKHQKVREKNKVGMFINDNNS